jgi:prepilin-type N-terminal cleavage/methylation domain-containing protein
MEGVLRQRAGLSSGARRRAGFTLVEVIVVLVILAILAAIAIPALTGYIDKAHEKALISQARASAEAIQTWASEHFANGDVGDEGLKNGDGPVSLVNYTGGALQRSLPFAGVGDKAGIMPYSELSVASVGGKTNGSAAAAEYGLPFTVASNNTGGAAATAEYELGESPVITAEPYRGDEMIYKVADDFFRHLIILNIEYVIYDHGVHVGGYYKTLSMEYHVYSDGHAALESGKYSRDVKYPLTYDLVAYGASPVLILISDVGLYYLSVYFEVPPYPEGYEPTEATKALIEGKADLFPAKNGAPGEIVKDEYTIHLVYGTAAEGNGEEGGDEGGDGDGASDWVKIVDKLASTNLAAAGYTITEVNFSDMNLLTHMKLTEPENGDFVVYADGAYTFNFDPVEGDAT